MTTAKPGEVRILPVILIAAVVQGWSLYALHQSIKHSHWPATDAAWLIALYAVVAIVPLTIQFLAAHIKSRAHAVLVAIIGIAFFYFGWHHGDAVLDQDAEDFLRQAEFGPIAFVLAVLWLLVMPFVQARLSAGKWSVAYPTWFALAWRNKLTLAEAALFTGLFWLLLLLWQELFHMLGIDFFKELFTEPLFIYPVTSLIFGFALHLIGSIERLTQLVLEQILNVLKWLAILAGLILALFTLALAVQLPGMIASDQRAIGAAWLLWLVAVMVLLLNAAYRDGSVERPYPKWLALALRCVVPFTVVVAMTALYSLIVRVHHYGLTVERVWAFVVAAMALIYSVGYSITAFGKGPWLNGMACVNVTAAVILIVVIAATLTPVLSPYRLAANSQFALAQQPLPVEGKNRETPFHYLRFDAGRYGQAKLRELEKLEGDRAVQIREAAAAAIASKNRYGSREKTDLDSLVANLQVFPAGRSLEPEIASRLPGDLLRFDREIVYASRTESLGVYVDLNDDKADEFAFLSVNSRGLLYAFEAGKWVLVGKSPDYQEINWNALLGNLSGKGAAAEAGRWRDLKIGTYTFRFDEISK